MLETLTYRTIIENTFKTVHKTLTQVKILQNTLKTVQKALRYQKIKTEHIQNTAQGTNFTNSHQNKYKTVRETLMQQTVK